MSVPAYGSSGYKFYTWLEKLFGKPKRDKEARQEIQDYYNDYSANYDLLVEIYSKYGESAAQNVAAQLGLSDIDWDKVKSQGNTDYNLGEYMEGLLASQGAENEINRQYNAAQALANREFQHEEAQLQRDWYESMSNSAYQRSVADMKAAGINPILAYSQGGAASSGTGVAAGSAAAYTATGGDTISSILSAAADVIQAVSGASAKKVDSAFKIFKMLG